MSKRAGILAAVTLLVVAGLGLALLAYFLFAVEIAGALSPGSPAAAALPLDEEARLPSRMSAFEDNGRPVSNF